MNGERGTSGGAGGEQPIWGWPTVGFVVTAPDGSEIRTPEDVMALKLGEDEQVKVAVWTGEGPVQPEVRERWDALSAALAAHLERTVLWPRMEQIARQLAVHDAEAIIRESQRGQR